MNSLNHFFRYLQEYEAVEHDISQDFSSDEFGNFNRELTAEEDMNARLDRVAGNPIHTFLLMRRLTRDWQAIQSLDSELEWQGWSAITKQISLQFFADN